jgi:uncharacterized membrane protein YdjX (TVP38/TMEM64 family)
MLDPSTSEPARASGGTTRLVKIAVGVLALGALLVLGRMAGDAIPGFTAWVDGLGVWGPAAFMLTYAASVVALVPASLLTLAAGAIFGIASGTLYAFVAATLGAAGAFLVSRYLARGAIERKLAGNVKFRSIDNAIGEEGRKIVFLLRLSPIFPFVYLNYALGLTRIGFADYVVASVGMLPGTLLYVYSGKVAGDVAALAAGVELDRGPADYAVWIFGLVATILATALVTRTARRALAEATGEPTADAA